jgi:hypothetical protein
MVPQVQTPSRCCHFLLSPGNRWRRKALGVTRLSPPLRVSSVGTRIGERRRLCDAKTQLTIPGAQPSSLDLCVVGPGLFSPASRLGLCDLHSPLGWTTILSSRLCPEICWLATAAVNPHPLNILRDGWCAWNGQHDIGPCILPRCCLVASPPLPRKTSSTAGSSKGKPAGC